MTARKSTGKKAPRLRLTVQRRAAPPFPLTLDDLDDMPDLFGYDAERCIRICRNLEDNPFVEASRTVVFCGRRAFAGTLPEETVVVIGEDIPTTPWTTLYCPYSDNKTEERLQDHPKRNGRSYDAEHCEE